MLQLFMAGGPFMWFLLVLLFVIIGLGVSNAMQVFGKKTRSKIQIENGINSILFWGVFSAVIGFFAHFLGLYQAFTSIMAAADINPAIIGGGYAVSLITVLFGMFIFMISALIWFVLKTRFAQLEN